MRHIIIILCLLIFKLTALQCHYTCQSCNQSQYTACISCPNGQSLSYQIVKEPISQGTCGKITINNINAVGIIVLLVAVPAGAIIFNEQVIYLILFLQSLGLFYLVQVYWLPILDYVLSGLTYLMIFTKITYNYKENTSPELNPEICKARLFFKQFQIADTFLTVGLADLVLFVFILTLLVFKYWRKYCFKQRAQILPDWLIDKLVLMFSTTFLFLIQESITAIFFSLKYGSTSGSSIALIVVYLMALILFIFNHISFPLPFFRNKFSQINTILGKILVPGFLLGSTNTHFLAFLFMIITWVLDLIATHKNRNSNSINRLLGYKIVNLLCLMMLTIYYMVDLLANKENISRGIGIFTTIVLFASIHFFGFEIFIIIRKNTCDQQAPKEKKVVHRSDKKQNEDLTLQNIKVQQRDNTQQNVLERINFDFQSSEFRRQTAGVPYTYQQHQIQELSQSKRQEQGRQSSNSERQAFEDRPQNRIEVQPIVVRHQTRDNQDLQQPKGQIKSEMYLLDSKISNKHENINQDGQQVEDREMTGSNVPMKKQHRKRFKKNKKDFNASQ